jgi:hypothetical protein
MFSIPGHKGNENENDRVSCHPSQNGYHQEHKQQQMLVRMWEKGTLTQCWLGM